MSQKVESNFRHSTKNNVVKASFGEGLNFITSALQGPTFLENNAHRDKFPRKAVNASILADDLGIGLSAIPFPTIRLIQFLFNKPFPLCLTMLAKCDLRQWISEEGGARCVPFDADAGAVPIPWRSYFDDQSRFAKLASTACSFESMTYTQQCLDAVACEKQLELFSKKAIAIPANAPYR